MDRNLLEISDGKLYGLNDMARCGCHDCRGCSACCQGMGDSILLDPWDVHCLMEGLGVDFQGLMERYLDLHQEAGLILPNLRMVAWEQKVPQAQTVTAVVTDPDACVFLNEEGRCSIHSFRPGLCRLFPMGRNYEGGRLNYFVLTHECPAQGKSKVKVEKWIGIGRGKDYQHFLITWHQLTGRMREEVTADLSAEEANRRTSLMFLQYFYAKPYRSGDFFREFEERAAALGL